MIFWQIAPKLSSENILKIDLKIVPKIINRIIPEIDPKKETVETEVRQDEGKRKKRGIIIAN